MEETSGYLAEFEKLRAFRGGEPVWLGAMRTRAIERFAEVGFPTTDLEAWKYTSLAPLSSLSFARARESGGQGPLAESAGFPGMIAHRLVFLDGRFRSDLSDIRDLPLGCVAGSLASALSKDPSEVERHLARLAEIEANGLIALNTALFEDGAFIRIPAKTVVELPIVLVFVSSTSSGPAVCHPRVLVVAGQESEVTVVESYAGSGEVPYFTNAVTEIFVGENAVVRHLKLQHEAGRSFHLATIEARQERASTFVSHSISAGGAIARNDLKSVLAGEGASCTLNGLYLTVDEQHVDNHTIVDHATPHGTSLEIYKGVLDGKSTAVFNGQVLVRKDAQKTDARQTNKNLLLSEGSTVNTKPQLEILADDVKCTHGATIGQLDEDSIFYLRSRGIGVEAARDLLTYAFASEVVDRIELTPVRLEIDRLLLSRLPIDGRRREGSF